MQSPKMIIFDYGQTLVDETNFDGLRGTEAVLREAAHNPDNVSCEEVQALAGALFGEIRRLDQEIEHYSFIEVHNHIFQNFLYDYFGIELTRPPIEIERIFWNAATSCKPTPNINEFLKFLDSRKIRTGVISNISFSGKALLERIDQYIPNNGFEFVIASSEYMFRKPHKRIFEIALRKAKLEPHEVWYCGDHAVFDVDGAANSGIYPVWYKGAIETSNRYTPKSNCLEISNWNQLIEVLGGSL